MSTSQVSLNITTSEKNKEVVRQLTNKLNLGAENVIARLAFAYSIARGAQLDLGGIQDNKGKSYKEDTILGGYRSFYVALICQTYGIHKADPSIGKYLKMHIDHGLDLLWKMYESNEKYMGLDFILEQVDRGIDGLEGVEVSPEHVNNRYQNITLSEYKELIELEIGQEVETGETVTLRFNDVNIHDNRHMAVAGQSGSGKTQFALEVIRQLSQKTKDKAKFLFLDFKGLKKGEEKTGSRKIFFDATGAKYIDAPQTPFPLNPLQFIDLINEKDRFMGINKFVDIIAKYANLGKVQIQQLKEATREAFIDAPKGEHPTFKTIQEKVLEIAGDKPSTLTEIMDSLSTLDMFRATENPKNHFLQNSYYLSLSGNLSNEVRLTATFLIINYIYNIFANMDDAPIEKGIMNMRYVLVIDEAHVIFKDKKSQDILESMLRELRSKGISIMMLSQGIDEFVQPTFDFSSNCELGFLLPIKDLNAKKVSRFLGAEDNNKLARSLEKVKTGTALSKLQSLSLIELTQLFHNK